MGRKWYSLFFIVDNESTVETHFSKRQRLWIDTSCDSLKPPNDSESNLAATTLNLLLRLFSTRHVLNWPMLMCDGDPAKGQLTEAPRRTQEDVALDLASLVQLARPLDPLIRSYPSTDELWKYWDHRGHEEVAVGSFEWTTADCPWIVVGTLENQTGVNEEARRIVDGLHGRQPTVIWDRGWGVRPQSRLYAINSCSICSPRIIMLL